MKMKTFCASGKGEEKITEFRVYGMEPSGMGERVGTVCVGQLDLHSPL